MSILFPLLLVTIPLHVVKVFWASEKPISEKRDPSCYDSPSCYAIFDPRKSNNREWGQYINNRCCIVINHFISLINQQFCDLINTYETFSELILFLHNSKIAEFVNRRLSSYEQVVKPFLRSGHSDGVWYNLFILKLQSPWNTTKVWRTH